jgi:hypothetical protein
MAGAGKTTDKEESFKKGGQYSIILNTHKIILKGSRGQRLLSKQDCLQRLERWLSGAGRLVVRKRI